MKICLYTDTALPKMGGQELVVDALAREFQSLGHGVSVLAPHPKKKYGLAAYESPYPIHRHPRFYSSRYLVDYYQWFLRRHYRREKFDVLHCHGIYPPAYLAALVARQCRFPYVVTSHGGDIREGSLRHSKPIVERKSRLGIQHADALIAISNFTREGYVRLGADSAKIITIPNGVSGDQFSLPIPPADVARLSNQFGHKKFILFIGRLKDRKGVDVLIKSYAQLPTELQNKFKLVIAGDGEDKSSLEELAHSLDLMDQVVFVGKVFGKEKTWLLQNALITTMPTRTWEAFPLVVLESYSAGTPVLGTNVPGLTDIIMPEKTGWVTKADCIAGLGQRLNTILTNPEQLEPMGQYAREFSKQYQWRIIAEKHIALYQQCLSNQAPNLAG